MARLAGSGIGALRPARLRQDPPVPSLARGQRCGRDLEARLDAWQSGAVESDGPRLARAEPPELLGAARACVLDDAEAILGGEAASAERLLHLFNSVVERGGQVLLAARAAPARWPCGLADLGSRLAAATAVRLEAPDDGLIEAVLVKLCADRQLAVGEEVLRYLLARMERSFAAARALVAALDRASLAEGRAVTVPLARQVLEGYETPRD